MLSEGKALPKNVVFNLISSDNYDNTYTQKNLLKSAGTVNSIKILDDALNQFFASNPDVSKEYELFCNRLTDHDNFTSAQPYHEITTAYEIGKKIGFDNVQLFSLSGSKKPDLLLYPNGKRIFLELTALETRTPEKKITEIASVIANYILKKTTKKDYFISIVFDTFIVTRFKDDRGYILEKGVISYIKEMIDRLRLSDLIGINGSLNFHDRQIHLLGKKMPLSPSPVEAILHIGKEYDENKSVTQLMHLEIIDSSKSEKDLKDYQLIQSWANKITIDDFLNSPFDTVGYYTGGGNECVYINSLDFDSTDENLKDSYLVSTSQIVKKPFISHIKRRIKDKVDSSQFEAGSPFVIGIKASQWQYEYEWDYDDFVPIRNEVQEYLKKYPEVSGVILFTSDLYHGKFVENPNAAQKVTKGIFEKAGILYPHIEPQFTHDRKVALSNIEYSQKVARIKQLVNEETNLQISSDGDFDSYVKQDLEELLTNIKDFLGEKTLEPSLLSLVEPIIKKYCKFKGKREDDSVKRDDPIFESNMLILGSVPLRTYAVACLMRLTWHRPSADNLTLINSLAEDSNSYVREAVCSELAYLYEVNPENCINLAKKYCFDNKFVRWYLRIFLGFLVRKDRKQALEFFVTIIDNYGKLNMEDQGEDILLRFAVDVVTQVSLLQKESDYLSLLENMVMDTRYNMNLRKQIIVTMTKPSFTSNQTIAGKTINYYLLLARTSSLEQKSHVEFFFFYNLIQRKTSLIPTILPLLDELSNITYDKPIQTYDHTYHFMILDYIFEFFEEFPEAATQYFLRVIEHNEFLVSSLKTSVIIKILDKIFNTNIDISSKGKAKLILDRVDQNLYWQARNLAEKLRDL
jgi:hypothetical protein